MESERNLMNTTEAARYLGVKPSYLYKKTTRSAIGAKAQTILDFLRQCTPYEADSIRVMVGHATGKGDTDTIEATDLLAVNRFLNHGLTKENATGNEAVMRHRQERAQKLMSRRNSIPSSKRKSARQNWKRLINGLPPTSKPKKKFGQDRVKSWPDTSVKTKVSGFLPVGLYS